MEAAVQTVQSIWQIEPVRGIRMPEPNAQQTVDLDLLWTDGGLRPRANNLAFLIQQINQRDLELWKQRLKAWTIRGGLLVSSDELYLVQPRSDASGELEQTILDLDTLRETLVSPKPHLFTPKALAKLRQGQLSLADLEEEVSERSFSFLDRQQQRLGDSFQEGIDAALKLVDSTSSSSSRSEIKGHTIRFAIAYLGARILQDKNFFGSSNIIKAEDPLGLLDRMVEVTNGFFRRARTSADYVPDRVRQELALYMGNRVSFVLTDHRDVGRLYEEAIKKLPRELGSDDWGDLNRHYTPVKLAERMLEALPIERLRPEERYIFDPAAGSGSLILAATSRLAGMRDIPTGEDRKEYLRSHVLANDLDRYANLVAQLRYFLASESLGIASETSKIADILPFPSSFTIEDYQRFSKENFVIRPRIIVANSPFAIEGNIQKSAAFVEQATNWLQDGDQFAFVLPSSFLTGGNKFDVATVRESLSSKCQLFEIWQCPVGTVGVNARQDVCIVSGVIEKSKHYNAIAKKVISEAEAPSMRENGYLGSSWLIKDNLGSDWSSGVAPQISLSVSTISLGNLFFIFNGVKHRTGHPPVAQCPENRLCKPTWRMSWGGNNALWADPAKVDRQQQWVIYDDISLESPRYSVAHLFDKNKILVGRIANTASTRPITAHLDTEGFYPNNSIWCILPIEEAQKNNPNYGSNEQPENWGNFSLQDKRLWLLGILASDLAAELSMPGRDKINLTKPILLQLPLPAFVDKRLIEKTAQIIHLEQNHGSLQDLELLRQELNILVEESYGNPIWKKPQRTGKSAELKAWKVEQNIQTKTTIGQVLEISEDCSQIYMYISRLMDDDDTDGVWIPLPQEVPGWALDGTPFEAELSHDVKTFEQLIERPWALRRFRHTPRPYLSDNELDDFLKLPELEVAS
ncbi:N-6 DNA methylase [Chamaesiphon sp. OTE_75_metabat_556]|uniref:N-6 DNA methylase n=1 Tax=Chamaesiphon sp. OTE_75_metabat_556 TaxID=2964692 RepID=UPI00286D4290|nr:N-6 DNA methylase [Chamaesiphon sp. OTE_75_metabat_556]